MILITMEKLRQLAEQVPAHLRRREPRRILAFDVETPNNRSSAICSIGLTALLDDEVQYTKEFLMDPEAEFDWRCIRVHGIRAQDVEGKPNFRALWPQIEPEFSAAELVIAHNAPFDLGMLKRVLARYDLWMPPVRFADTVVMSRRIFGDSMPNHKLGTLCSCLGIDLDAHHAGSDSYGCAEVYARLLRRAGDLTAFEQVYSFD